MPSGQVSPMAHDRAQPLPPPIKISSQTIVALPVAGGWKQSQAVSQPLMKQTLAPSVEDDVRHPTMPTLSPSPIHMHWVASTLPPEFLAQIADSAATEAERILTEGGRPMVMTAPTLRPQVKRILETRAPDLAVLSYLEITPDVTIESAGIVRVEHES